MSIRNQYSPNDPCPCNSGRLSRECCMLSKGLWLKLPAKTSPSLPATGISNPACYLAKFSDCCQKISREHYISDTVLSEVEHLKTVKIAGLPWIPKEKFKKVGKPGLSSKILCCRHNSNFSPLDSEIGRLVRTIGHFDRDFNSAKPTPEIAVFCGEDIERWMLKTVCGMIAGKQIARNKQPLPTQISEIWTELLLGTKEWPEGWGLYISVPNQKVYHSTSFEFVPKTHPVTHQVLAADFILHGIQFSLLLAKPDHPSAWGVYRPRTLEFTRGFVEKVMEITWLDQKYGSFVNFNRIGTYDGEPPNWPEWARMNKNPG